MKAFFVAQINIKNPEKFQQYAQGAGASMQPYGGELVTKGKAARQLAGVSEYGNVAIVSFPNQESLESWFESDAYQNLISLRDEAADMLLTSYNVPSP